MTEQNPEQPHPAELELARLRAGLTAGLTVEQSTRLQGATPEELAADAATFAAELNATTPVTPALRVGGNQGPDVGTGAGTVAAGVAAYRAKHGLDEDGRRPEKPAVPTSGRNPFETTTYSMETR
ncbi:hypothetical protein G3I62_27270 [Streptomyces sp. SID14446]|uniref:hypothetical protein n=1 Tax=Streptomyces sp. SID14446 TaxID=2706072 RepID=UPI0013B8C9BF|nr:hypothetical protein [Streptomyces sp. SID14446]NEB32750.1 hypothetical protein [Streptomyces sp. SID14446]